MYFCTKLEEAALNFILKNFKKSFGRLQVNFRLNIQYFTTIWTVLVVYWFVLIKCFQFSWDLPTLKSFFESEKQGIRCNPLYRIEPN